MMTTSKYSRYLAAAAAILAAAVCAVWFLAGWPAVSAHEDPADDSHVHGPEFNFERTDDELVLRADVSQAEGASFVEEDGAVVWQYVGPSTADDINNCNELGWLSLAEKAKSIEATVDGDGGMAETNLDVSSAADQSRYCFRVQIDTDAGLSTYHLQSPRLETSADPQQADDVGLTFAETAPPADSDVPSSVTVTVAGNATVDGDSWQHVAVSEADDCNSSNDSLEFPDGAAENNALALGAEDAGTVVCFRVQLADGSDYIYWRLSGAGNGCR